MKIGYLSRATNTKVETIRFYEAKGLLAAPARTTGNYRDFGVNDLRRLSFIRRSRDLGFSLDQVRALVNLSDDGERSCAEVDAIATKQLAEVERKIADLQSLRRELGSLIRNCRQGTVAECHIIDALGSPQIAGQPSA